MLKYVVVTTPFINSKLIQLKIKWLDNDKRSWVFWQVSSTQNRAKPKTIRDGQQLLILLSILMRIFVISFNTTTLIFAAKNLNLGINSVLQRVLKALGLLFVQKIYHFAYVCRFWRISRHTWKKLTAHSLRGWYFFYLWSRFSQKWN